MSRQRRTNFISQDETAQIPNSARPSTPHPTSSTRKKAVSGKTIAVKASTNFSRKNSSRKKRGHGGIVLMSILVAAAAIGYLVYSKHKENQGSSATEQDPQAEAEVQSAASPADNAPAPGNTPIAQQQAPTEAPAKTTQPVLDEDQKELADFAALQQKRKLEQEKKLQQLREQKLAEQKKQEAKLRKVNALKSLEESLAAARDLALSGNFTKAAITINTSLVPDIPQEHPAYKIYKSYNSFARTMGDIKPGPEATADGMFVFQLKDGRKITAKLGYEEVNDITIIQNGGVRMILPRKKIVSQKPVSQDKLNEQHRKEIIALAREAKTGVEFYNIAIHSLELGQKGIAIKAFNKALKMDEDVGQNYREYCARQLFASAAFNRSIKKNRAAERKFDELIQRYPDTKAGQMAKDALNQETQVLAQLKKKANADNEGDAQDDAQGTKAEDKEENEKDKTGDKDDAKSGKDDKSDKEDEKPAGDDKEDKKDNAEKDTAKEMGKDLDKAKKELKKSVDVTKADKLLSESAALEKKAQSTKDRKEANKLYKEAVGKLSKALTIYQNYLDKHKADEKLAPDKEDNEEALKKHEYYNKIVKKQEEAAKRFYWCKKMQTL